MTKENDFDKADLIKNTWKGGKGHRCGIYTRFYNHKVSYLNWLLSIVKEDYPEVKEDDVEIHVFGGSTKKGMLTLEFSISGNPKEDYTSIQCPDVLMW